MAFDADESATLAVGRWGEGSTSAHGLIGPAFALKLLSSRQSVPPQRQGTRERIMGSVLTWLLSGLFAGWVVRVAMRSRRDFGILGDLTLGSLGGLIGGWLFRYLGVTAPDGGIAQVFVAVSGAGGLVGGLRVFRRLVDATGVRTALPALALDVDLEKQVRLLNDFERRVLGRLLGRKPSTQDPNRMFDAQLTFGDRIADRVAAFGGSWTFIGLFVTILVFWMIINEQSARPFDPYPFILLNLVLSFVAALQAPVIMMSQNRLSAKDRLDARSDYEVNLRAEMEIMGLHTKLDAVREREWTEMLRVQQEQVEVLRRIEARLVGADARRSAEAP
jgi:uncharacterized membrane protein/uncharacterized membrane protein YeaQ/YmgE (transglycosylase-associated protein family)